MSAKEHMKSFTTSLSIMKIKMKTQWERLGFKFCMKELGSFQFILTVPMWTNWKANSSSPSCKEGENTRQRHVHHQSIDGRGPGNHGSWEKNSILLSRHGSHNRTRKPQRWLKKCFELSVVNVIVKNACKRQSEGNHSVRLASRDLTMSGQEISQVP